MGLSPRALKVSQWVLAFWILTTSLKINKILHVWFTHTFLSNWANLKLYLSTGLVSNKREQFQRVIQFLPNFIICKADNLLFIMYLLTITTGDLFLCHLGMHALAVLYIIYCATLSILLAQGCLPQIHISHSSTPRPLNVGQCGKNPSLDKKRNENYMDWVVL